MISRRELEVALKSLLQKGGPPEKRGWSQSGQCRIGYSSKQVTIQANFDDPGYYTLQFSVGAPKGNGGPPGTGGLVTGTPPNPWALITWTVEGNAVTRLVSVGNAVSVSGTGQAMRAVVFDTVSLGSPNANTQFYDVSIQVTKGTRPAENQPATLEGKGQDAFNNPTLDGVQNLAAGGDIIYIVPPNAGVISVEVVAVPTLVGGVPAECVVTHESPTDPKKRYDPRINTGYVSLGQQVSQVRVTNRSVANAVNITLTWGIDG